MKEVAAVIPGLSMMAVHFYSVLLISVALSRRLLPGCSRLDRLLSTSLVSCGLLSFNFAILMFAGWFAPLPSMVLAVAELCLVWKRAPRNRGFTNVFRLDIFPNHRGEFHPRGWIWNVTAIGFLLFAALLGVRSLMHPLLGWDSLTYHAVKAGMWIQANGWHSLEAPGGWEYYGSFFGGGEMHTAWAMLFTGTDLFAGCVDLFFWILLGLAASSSGIEFGLAKRTSFLVCMAFLSNLELSRAVGSGYVDTCGNAMLLAGIAFLLKFIRDPKLPNLLLVGIAFGIAGSVKINLLATCVLMSLPVVVIVAKCRGFDRKALLMYAVCLMLPVLPWLVSNYLLTGYPFGCTPIGMGALQLGKMPPNLLWCLDRPDLVAYGIVPESRAFTSAIRSHGMTLLLVFLGLPGLICGALRLKAPSLVALSLVGIVMTLYMSSSFATVRLGWAEVNGRFLVPVLFTVALSGLPFLTKTKFGMMTVESVSLLCVIHGFVSYLLTYVCNSHADEAVFLMVAASLSLGIVLLARGGYFEGRGIPRGLRIAGPVLLILVAAGLNELKGLMRLHAYSYCVIMHPFPRYWLPALAALAKDGNPCRIAVTYGPMQTSHHAFLAPFMGERLQNELVYISPEADGRIIPHDPEYFKHAKPDVNAWIAALEKSGATHVLAMMPQTLEIEWMEQRPERFQRLAGVRGIWGLYLAK